MTLNGAARGLIFVRYNGGQEGKVVVKSALMTTGPCLRSDRTIYTVGTQSPFLSLSSQHFVGQPDSTGSVSGRVSRCSAQTSAQCASAQWTGRGNIEFLLPHVSSDIKFYWSFSLLLFLLEPSGVASQIWDGSSWKLSCTVHPCIREFYGKLSGNGNY